ncbi:DUF6132 family protein [Bacteroidota bacterium]
MNRNLKLAIGAGAGALLGYAYYYFIGCSSGSCPITSNWHISTMYGAVMGILLAFPIKKKAVKDDKEESKEDDS